MNRSSKPKGISRSAGFGNAGLFSETPQDALEGLHRSDGRNRDTSHKTILTACNAIWQTTASVQLDLCEPAGKRSAAGIRAAESPIATTAVVQHLVEDLSRGVGPRRGYRDGQRRERPGEMLESPRVNQFKALIRRVADDDVAWNDGTLPPERLIGR